jgi:CubicO group peptidase (beta-lactamase class C family)
MTVLADPAGPVDKVVPATAPITVRNLLTHTAGLGYTIVQTGPIRDAYAKAGIMPFETSRVPVPGFGETHTAPSLAAFADNLAQLPLVYQPGTRWSYSVGLDLLGRVIELASGQEFAAFLKARFFDPLGMDSTSFQLARADVPRFTTNYVVADGRLLPIDVAANSIFLDRPAFPFGGAGLISSPRDYDRFLAMLLNGGVFAGKRVMSQRAVDMGTSNLLPPDASTAGTWIAGHGFGAGGRVGLGDAAGTYGWSGAAGTIGFISNVGGVRAGFYAQFMPSTTYPFSEAFPQAVRSDARAHPGPAQGCRMTDSATLARALPSIAYAGNPLDRADAVRSDPARLAAVQAAPGARLLVLDGLAPEFGADGGLTWAPLATAGEGRSWCSLAWMPIGRAALPPWTRRWAAARRPPRQTCARCSMPCRRKTWRSMAGRAAWSTGMRATASAPAAAMPRAPPRAGGSVPAPIRLAARSTSPRRSGHDHAGGA